VRSRIRILGDVLGLVVIAGAGLWLMRDQIALAVMNRVYERAFAADPLASLPDGLHVGLCGSGSPMPDPTRAGPCEVVVAGRRLFVIDSGEGSTKNLSLMRLPPAQVSAVFLTHYHSDHIADLGELMLQHWAGEAATSPLTVYGPTGVDQVVAGFEQAYMLDRGYRIAHHGPKIVPPGGFGGAPHAFAVSKTGPDVTLIDEPDLKVVAFPVDHEPVEPAVGYKFTYKGRTVVISGDTAPSARVEAAAHGADVLVHEGLAPNLVADMRTAALRHGRANLAAIMHDILSYHTTPEQAAAIAERAHVRMLLFTHVIPPLPFGALNGPYLGRAPGIFHGPIRVGRDGDFISLPAGGAKIDRSNRLQRLFQE
jgi:ribonuclease Z